MTSQLTPMMQIITVSKLGGTIKGKCRSLTKEEALEILWTLNPPAAAQVTKVIKSTWLNPLVDGKYGSMADVLGMYRFQ